MEGFQQIEDIHSASVIDLEVQPLKLLKENLIIFHVNRSHIFLLLPGGEVFHQLLGDRLHVEATGADGHPWKVEAGDWLGGVLQSSRD